MPGCSTQQPINADDIVKIDWDIARAQSGIEKTERMTDRIREQIRLGTESNDPLMYAVVDQNKDTLSKLEANLIEQRESLSGLYRVRAKMMKELR
jgi:hypothetical protein